MNLEYKNKENTSEKKERNNSLPFTIDLNFDNVPEIVIDNLGEEAESFIKLCKQFTKEAGELPVCAEISNLLLRAEQRVQQECQDREI